MKRKTKLIASFPFILALLILALALPGESGDKKYESGPTVAIERITIPKAQSVKSGHGFGIGLRIHGGMNFLNGGELNDGVAGLVDAYAYFIEKCGYTSTSTTEALHSCFEGGVDLLVFLGERFGLSLGASFLNSRQENVVDHSQLVLDYKFIPTVEAIPVNLGFFYIMPLTKTFNLNFEVGAGYAFARVKLEKQTITESQFINESSQGRAGCVTLTGRVGLEAKVRRNVFLFAELLGRLAKISGFEGSSEYTDNGILLDAYDSALYSYDSSAYGPIFHIINFKETAPAGAENTNVRLAEADLSGVSMRAGIRIRF